MGVRVNKLLAELNMGLVTLDGILKSLGQDIPDLNINTKISDDIAILVKEYFNSDTDILKIVQYAAKNGVYGSQEEQNFPLKIVGRIDLDALGSSNIYKHKQELKWNQQRGLNNPPLKYSENPSFWINELIVLSPDNEVNRIELGAFSEADKLPLYSVLIGTNGAGKSCLMKELVDFFIDLHSSAKEKNPKLSPASKGRLKGIRYHIDGVECEVFRLTKNYFARVDGCYRNLQELRFPSIVACHFGAFDKLPTQKVNGSAQTRYDVDCYKYVGAHVNGSMISSSAIAFRLLFALNEEMDVRQRQNIRSTLDFIGYDHRISLSYTLVMRTTKDGKARISIMERVKKDREYDKLSNIEKNEVTTQIYNFYKTKTDSRKNQHYYEIDFDDKSVAGGSIQELRYIYKLKQYDLISATNVTFHKQGNDISSDDMSSGEFAMLSTVLSISAAANNPHTLVLLDEPELSLHPNWQMTLIDNLDRALANRVCHLLIATHSHMLVSDLPMKRSAVTQIEKDGRGNLYATTIPDSTYGWSAEEVLLKVFKTATDRNRYFGERIGNLLEKMGNNSIAPEDVADELKELQEISMHLSDIDPMKTVLNTIVETFYKQ